MDTESEYFYKNKYNTFFECLKETFKEQIDFFMHLKKTRVHGDLELEYNEGYLDALKECFIAYNQFFEINTSKDMLEAMNDIERIGNYQEVLKCMMKEIK